TALSGTGQLAQAASATLNIGGTCNITTLTASASGNTVNYNAGASQTIVATSYVNLGISGGSNNIKTLNGDVTVGGTLTIAASTILSFSTGTAKTLTLSGTGSNTL